MSAGGAPADAGPLLVPDLLSHGFRRYPDRDCVVVDGAARSFAEVSGRASQLADLLRERGLGDGARVALLSHNEPEYVEVRVGSQRAGSIVVPLNYRLSESELRGIVADCAPELVVAGPEYGELAARLGVPWVLELGPDAPPERSYEAALAGRPAAPPPAGLDGSLVTMLAYTSGTTSRPKGVMLTNWSAHATMLAMGQEIGAHPDATYLACTPMFHIGHTVGFSFLYLGATHRQLRRFDAAEFAAVAAAGGVTHSQLVPAMVHSVLELGDPQPRALERVLYGAAPMPPDLLRRALEAWGCEFVNGYGSTEAMGISMLPPADHDPERRPDLLGSVGRSSPGTAVRLVDEDDRDVAPGEVGEVIARGPSLMAGYWGNPEATAEALRGGWMHTGDLGYRDRDGYLHLVDRRNDKIVTGGENVYPSEVEHRLTEHPEVLEAAVVGVADDRWGERVAAAVVLRDGASADPDALIAHCRAALAPYKAPKEVRIVAALPRNATGKLLRREVRSGWA
ncbi:MAG: long-chain fatty acid--CoA ligase [Solirubrobacterales bacterium]|nr:long-chain fatty acid--CoA ligase [Solirubrobacterales bacterium]